MAEVIYDESVNQSIRPRFLAYAQSVLQDRAIPSCFDGLKPIHRRVLMSFYDLNILSNSPYRKSAITIGHCLGNYSPHGDQSAYDALVGLAQEFNMRYPLVDGSGNYGSINGTPAAAMRYTESRLSQYGELMCQGVETLAETKDNFDNSKQEPIDLPSYFPNLLMNGTSGIAVGFATKFAPHYAKDIYNAILYVIKCRIDKKYPDIEKIIDIIQAPDFPTGAQIINGLQVRNIYKTGKGAVVLRAKYIIEKKSIIYTEVPYKTAPNDIVQSIASLNISDIKDVRDETSKRTGVRIVVELRKGANTDWIINKLFKETPLQSNFNVNMVAIMNNKPETDLNIFQIICYYLQQLCKVHNRSIKLKLENNNKKLFNTQTMLDAIKEINDIIRIIRTEDNPVQKMMDELAFTKEEAEYIYNLKISSLSKASKEDLEQKKDQYLKEIHQLQLILSSETNFLSDIADKIKSIRDSKIFKNDHRRTEILNLDLNNSQDMRSYIKNEPVIITYSNKGQIKATRPDEYKTTKRNTMGIKTKTLREDEFITNMLILNTHDNLLLFSDIGRCYLLPVYKIPIASKNAASKSINNFVNLMEDETIIKVVALTDTTDKSVVMVTKRGYIKRIDLALLTKSRISTVGTKAISLSEDDKIKAVNICDKNEDIVIFTSNGRGLKLNIDDEAKPIRMMGKTAKGVSAIKLTKDEYVVNAAPIKSNQSLIIVTTNGYGKRIDVSAFKNQKRNQTPINYMSKSKLGPIVNGIFVSENEELLITTRQGQILRMNVDNIKPLSRTATGLSFINIKDKDDYVVSISAVNKEINSDEQTENAD